MDIETILKTIKESPELQNLLNMKSDAEEDLIDDKEDFYKPGYYELDEEYKKYKQILQKGEQDKTIFFRIGRINHYWENKEEAIKYYNKALEIDPLYGECHYNLGNIYYEQKRFEESREHYLKAVEDNPCDIYALNALARNYFRLKEFDEGEKFHKKALENNPEDLYALRGLGNISLLKQSYGEAFNYYYKALDVNPFDGFTLYNIGLIHILSGKLLKAEEHYKEHLERQNFFGFHFGLGLLYYKQGKKEDAYKHYKSGLARDYGADLDNLFSIKLDDPDWNLTASEVHFCKGNACYSLNNISRAIDELETAIEINPNFLEAHKFLARLYLEKGDYDAAIEYYENCLAQEKENIELEREVCELRLTRKNDDLESLIRLQHVYWAREDFKQEIEILEKIVKNSQEPEYLYKLAVAYLFDGEKEKSEEALKRLGSIKGQEDLANYGYAGFYLLQNDYGEALKSIKKALKKRKKPEYYVEAGNIYRKLGDETNTRESYFQAFKLAPYSRMVHSLYLKSLLTTKGDRTVDEIFKESSSLAGHNLLLGLFYIKDGNYEKARRSLLELKRNSENTGIFNLYMGICYQEEGYLERALDKFKSNILEEGLRGESYARMAIIYYELGNKENLIKMVGKANNFIRFIDPVLRYRLCKLMWESNFKEHLEEFLRKTIWSINFHYYVIARTKKEIVLKELNEIRKKLTEDAEEYRKTKIDSKESVIEEIKLKQEPLFALEPPVPISLEVGRGLLPLIDPNQGGKLLERIASIRKYIALDMGIIVPSFRFKNNLQLKPEGYIIKIKDIEVAQGEIVINSYLAVGPENYLKPLKGAKYFDPSYDMPGIWITGDQRGKAEKLGCMIFEPLSVIARQITEVVKCYACELLGRQEVKSLLDTVEKTHPDVVREIYPGLFTLGEIQNVLENLLIEKVSIRDLVTILETLGDYAHITKETDLLTEFVRQNLSSLICREYQDDEGRITCITLDSDGENIIAGAIKKTDYGSFLCLEPGIEKSLLATLGEQIQVMVENGIEPVVLCAPGIRRYLKRLTEKTFPNLTVLSFNEIGQKTTVNSIGVITLPQQVTDGATKKNLYLYHGEKMCLDPDPFVRCEGIKSLAFLAERDNLEKVFSYLEAGLRDEDEKVRHEAAKVIRELCSKKELLH